MLDMEPDDGVEWAEDAAAGEQKRMIDQRQQGQGQGQAKPGSRNPFAHQQSQTRTEAAPAGMYGGIQSPSSSSINTSPGGAILDPAQANGTKRITVTPAVADGNQNGPLLPSALHNQNTNNSNARNISGQSLASVTSVVSTVSTSSTSGSSPQDEGGKKMKKQRKGSKEDLKDESTSGTGGEKRNRKACSVACFHATRKTKRVSAVLIRETRKIASSVVQWTIHLVLNSPTPRPVKLLSYPYWWSGSTTTSRRSEWRSGRIPSWCTAGTER